MHVYNTWNKKIPNIGKHTASIFSKSFLTEVTNEWCKASQYIKYSKSVKHMMSNYKKEIFN